MSCHHLFIHKDAKHIGVDLSTDKVARRCGTECTCRTEGSTSTYNPCGRSIH